MTDLSPSPAERAAERYVEVATADGKGKLADLFAEDAVFHNPAGGIVSGREEIRAFYERFLRDYRPEFHIARMVASGDQCWIELANGERSAPDLLAANHFEVNEDGLIARLAVFVRPRGG
jgi:limonene-1,2-epoxide hydrolase